jgi:hypothetical protein
VAAVFTLVAPAACGGGGAKGAPKTLSLHGDQIPVSTLTNGLHSMCTVTHQALNADTAKVSYFTGPYTSLHQLAGILSGARSSQLISAMQAFEADVVSKNPVPASTVRDANALLALVDADLQSLKLSPVRC